MTGRTAGTFVYRLVARNDQPNSSNPIHRDEYARSLGYPGGLVPGVTLYAYAADAAVRALGEGWLERGYGWVRFRRPVFDGEALDVRAEPAADGSWRITLSCEGELRTEAAAGPYREEIAVDGLRREDGAEPRPLVQDRSMVGTPLAVPERLHLRREELDRYLADTGLNGTPLAAALRARGLVPPSLIANMPFALLRRNRPFAVGIHTGSEIETCAPALLERTLYAWGVVEDAFERKGRWYVTQRVVTADEQGNVVARMRYTGTFEPEA